MIKKISLLATLQFVGILLPMITIPYYIRFLGISGYGKIGVAVTINQYLILLVEYGFTLAAARDAAHIVDSFVQLSRMNSAILLIKLGIFILSMFSLLLGLKFLAVDVELVKLTLIGLLLVLGQLLTPTWLYLAKEKMPILLSLTILPRIIALPMVFWFVKTSSDIFIAMYLYAIPVLISGLLTLWFPFKTKWIEWSRCNFMEIKSQIISCWPIFLSGISTSFFTSSTPIILNAISGTFAAGVYLSVEKIRAAVLSGVTPISQVVFPRLNKLFINDISRASVTLQKITFFLLAGACLLVGFMIIYSNEILHLVFGKPSEEARLPFIFFSISIIFNILNTILGTYILIPLGFSNMLSRILIIAGLNHVLFLTILVNYFGSTGASACVLITDAFITILFVRYLSINSYTSKNCGWRSSILHSIIFVKNRKIV